MRNIFKIPILVFLVLLLILVRVFEDWLFFNPTMDFFKNIYNYKAAPEEIPVRTFLNIGLRYWINSLISLGIIFFSFQKKGILKFATLLYLLFFLILFPLFIILIPEIEPNQYQEIYYVRRFLIHPILVLILLPAFYYQQLKFKR